MRFEDGYTGWEDKCLTLTQEQAAELPGVYARSFRRYVSRYQDYGIDGLIDKRIGEASHRLTPVDEAVRLETLYRERYEGWNVKHFYERYQGHHRDARSYRVSRHNPVCLPWATKTGSLYGRRGPD
ncbi:MAG: hypothetical protein QF921_07865 [Pseudomonadales bacterium]|jgi:transposase|nr:hypothetical protein [Pseudomonadales bacterium]MDP6471753.1 hypothetical protein [Pseudomonadales bacterium]MDP6971415.1 hypothetical protein [Pseudomonadales bacterium]